MMNTSDVLAKMGYDAPRPRTLDCRLYGRWFQMMAPVASLSDEQLATQDVALLNMRSALGLPGTQWLTLKVIDRYIEKLDDWATQVGEFTERHQGAFERRPWEHDHSPGQFRMLCLCTYLCKHLDVQYNQAFTYGEYDARDPRNLLLHGLLSGHGGTCVTMPFLYIAIGRRLGYPLKLVHAREHCFVRWDEPGGERFNIETTSAGFNPRPDSHYLQWPSPISDEEVERGYFLRSLRPRQELASVFCQRAACFVDHLQLGNALLACFLAACLTADDEDQPAVFDTWAVVTLMARAMEEARKAAGLRDYDGIDLRGVRVPQPDSRHGACLAEVVRADLLRIARHREKARDAMIETTVICAGLS